MNENPPESRSTESKPATVTSSDPSNAASSPPSFCYYLVIHNIQKRPNVRNLLTTAAAFGCHGVFVVGQKKFNLDPQGPDIPHSIRDFVYQAPAPFQEQQQQQQQQQQDHPDEMFLQHFDKWADFVEYVRQESIRLIGVEIHKDAKPIDHYLVVSESGKLDKIAFLMGNEGQGLSPKQQEDCDGFVRIPQYGNGTASLNVNVAANIILQRVYQWCQAEAAEQSTIHKE